MPDDIVTPEVTPPTAAVVEPTVEPVVESTPHPLEPGGERFKEVYRDMQEARRDAARMQAELDTLKRQQAPQQQAQPQFYTPQQLQAMVDQGQVTPAVMTAQIAWQERQIAKQEMRAEFSQMEQFRSAGMEIQRYTEAIPRLLDRSSDEFHRVDLKTRTLAAKMNLPVEDPRVQEIALQATFGDLAKLSKTKVSAEVDRTSADTYVETSGGGGKGKPVVDPLKDVPAAYKQHWERLGYTKEQMVEEARWIRPTPRARSGLWKPG